jgi:hypothetical protein
LVGKSQTARQQRRAVFFDERLEGSRFGMRRKNAHISFHGEEGLNIGLNKRLPRITQRDVLSGGQFE